MSVYKTYLEDIAKRKEKGLNPKPIDDGLLVKELVLQIIDEKNIYREDSLNFLIYNVLPGTTNAANEKSKFFLNSLLYIYPQISRFELLSLLKKKFFIFFFLF